MKHYGTLILRLRRTDTRASLESTIDAAMSEFRERFHGPMSAGMEESHDAFIAHYALDWAISIHTLCQSDVSYMARAFKEHPLQEFESRMRMSDDYCFTVIVQMY